MLQSLDSYCCYELNILHNLATTQSPRSTAPSCSSLTQLKNVAFFRADATDLKRHLNSRMLSLNEIVDSIYLKRHFTVILPPHCRAKKFNLKNPNAASVSRSPDREGHYLTVVKLDLSGRVFENEILPPVISRGETLTSRLNFSIVTPLLTLY